MEKCTICGNENAKETEFGMLCDECYGLEVMMRFDILGWNDNGGR